MLVGERMSQPIITALPNTPITDALNLMREEHIRRLPVIEKGVLVGIVTNHDLLNASPSPATSLSIWEMTYLLSKITVADVMTKDVFTVSADTPIEEAARIMVDNTIGGLPVMENNAVVGIITETDIFKLFLELMGARDPGVRVTALVEEKPGELAKLSQSITNIGGNFVAFGIFAGEDPSNREVTFKVTGVEEDALRNTIRPYVQALKDIRST